MISVGLTIIFFSRLENPNVWIWQSTLIIINKSTFFQLRIKISQSIYLFVFKVWFLDNLNFDRNYEWNVRFFIYDKIVLDSTRISFNQKSFHIVHFLFGTNDLLFSTKFNGSLSFCRATSCGGNHCRKVVHQSCIPSCFWNGKK